ncbi:MAG: hypothetical protein WC792_03540 [Candidatus Micrarchaeia archaeon]|jgi:hypothetical protein
MDRNVLTAALVGVLLLVSVVQAVQLNGLNEKIKAVDAAAIASVKAPVQTQSGAPTAKPAGATVPKSLTNLPQMVGGC